MTENEAYRAGFLLKCAHLGMPADFAQVLYANPKAVIKSSIIGSLLGHGVNLGRGVLGGAADIVGASGKLGENIASGTQPGIPSGTQLPASLSDDVLRNILLAAHYRKAQQVLDSAKPAA
jgi:hypothetical protein